MDILAELAARIPTEYTFSAFALALLMVPVYLLTKNERVLLIIDKVLNRRLSQSNLYLFIRLMAVLVFLFSITFVVLAFATPHIAKYLDIRKTEGDQRQVELVLLAMEKFKDKDLAGAQPVFYNALAVSPDSPRRDEIEGMITATYYGLGAHEGGLTFICEAYKNRQQADYRHMFAIHAHLRALSLSKGAAYAEALAKDMRQKCGRDDFLEYWAHIPFGMMESLRQGTLRAEHTYELTPQAKERLLVLIGEKRAQAGTAYPPLIDYALYFLGYFDEIIVQMPYSRIIDLVIFDAAKFAQGDQRVAYLERMFKQQKNSPRHFSAVSFLSETLAEMGREKEAYYYIAFLREHQPDLVDRAARKVIDLKTQALHELVVKGDFLSARQAGMQACKDQEAYRFPCSKDIVDYNNRTAIVLTAVSKHQDEGACFAAYKDMKAVLRTEDGSRHPLWFRGAITYLDKCIGILGKKDLDLYAKALYVAASLSRQIDENPMSIAYLERFDREIVDHPLKDDVLTELLHHHVAVSHDMVLAKQYYDRIAAAYQDRNSFDNALWWVAKSNMDAGNYLSAGKAYGYIGAVSTSRRLREWSLVKSQGIDAMQFLPFSDIVWKNHHGNLVPARIGEGAQLKGRLSEDHKLVRACGAWVSNLHQLLDGIKSMKEATECEIWFHAFGGASFKLFGSSQGGWQMKNLNQGETDAIEARFSGST